MTEPDIRVVMADDHRMFVEAVERLFDTAAGLSLVGKASNGDELVALVRSLQPDVAIVDVSMPGPAISDLLATLGAVRPDCRVVVLTMHLEPFLAATLLDAGAQGYVVKEAAFEEMQHAVRMAHAGSRFVSARIEALMSEMDPAPRSLTSREIACLRGVADGQTNRRIAETLRISERTVRFHIANICRKLGTRRRSEAVAVASRQGLI